MSSKLYLDQIYSKSGLTKIIDTSSFDSNNFFESSNTGFKVNYQSSNAALEVIQSGTGNAMTVNTDKFVLDKDGNLNIAGNLTFPNSYGINFGNSTLDDYEEGTFEATLEYDTNLTGTLTNITTTSGISGTYTKIGNQVFARYSTLVKSSHTGNSDALLSSISLPFANYGLAHYSIYGYNLYGRYTTTILNNADLIVSTGNNDSKLYFSSQAGTSSGGSGYIVLTSTCHINVIYTTLS